MNYTVEELIECKFDDSYLFDEELACHLADALSYLTKVDADKVLESAFFTRYRGDSWHLSQKQIRERSVIIIDEKDLNERNEAIVTILHEAGHSFLGHGNSGGYSLEDMNRTEDECWNQVRHWLPPEFHECIDKAERLGSGSKGTMAGRPCRPQAQQ